MLFSGRGTRTRTLGTRFWRPLLYQLSYTPKFDCLTILPHLILYVNVFILKILHLIIFFYLPNNPHNMDSRALYSISAAATATLSDSACPKIGILILLSQILSNSSDTPFASFPTTITVFLP